MEFCYQSASKSNDVNDSEGEILPAKRLRIDKKNTKLKYCCFHCQGKRSSVQAYEDDIEHVYNHWLSTNCKSNLSVPFRFYVSGIVGCGHCDRTGLFKVILNHQRRQHSERPISFVDPEMRGKCGLCQYIGDELAVHYRSKHQPLSQNDTFNPINVSNEILSELLAIDIYKKWICKRCDKVFNRKIELKSHHDRRHGDKSRKFEQKSDRTIRILCDCCHGEIRSSKYVDHFKRDCKSSKCTAIDCKFETRNLFKMIHHIKHDHARQTIELLKKFKTDLQMRYLHGRVLFGNGLVMHKYNTIGKNTIYDDSEHFAEFIEELLAYERGFNYDNESVSSSRSGTSEHDVYSLLNDQNKIAKNVQITNIPKPTNVDPKDIFFEICNKCELNVNDSDIENILWRDIDECVIVAFKEMDMKIDFLEKAKKLILWSTDFSKNEATDEKTKVCVETEMTKYYRDMYRCAKKAQEDGVFYSVVISKYGLEIKHEQGSGVKIILSKEELQNYIKKYE